MPSPFIVQFDTNRAAELEQKLCQQGFEIQQPTHTHFLAKKKGVSVTLYLSGKLMVQGKDMEDFIRYFLEPEILHTFTYGYGNTDAKPHIGVDESGKGDFFGPLCVAAVYSDDIAKLERLGVKDSKKLNDATILKIAQKLRKSCDHAIVRLSPTKYNELYEKFSNLNHLLGWAHATVIEELNEKTQCNMVIIDQFAAEHVVENALKRKKREVELIQRTKGEEDLVVAAASILARATFVLMLGDLEKEFEMTLPKGASKKTIQAGKLAVKTYGSQILSKIGKLHFKTREDILS